MSLRCWLFNHILEPIWKTVRYPDGFKYPYHVGNKCKRCGKKDTWTIMDAVLGEIKEEE